MAAGVTYTPIATYTVSGSSTSLISFSSIPSTYTDLVIAGQSATSSNGSYFQVQYNSDGGSNYSATYITGNGSSASSGRNSNQTSMAFGYTGVANQFMAVTINIFNYANTTTYKTLLMRDGNAGTQAETGVYLWRSTAAINRIDITGSATFTAGSTFTLYGITAA